MNGTQMREVLATLAQHKLRSFLTIFGITWGVAAFLFADAVLEGFQSGQRKRFQSVGQNLVIVSGGRTSETRAGSVAGREIRLGLGDVAAVIRQVRGVRQISPELTRYDLSAIGPRGRVNPSVHGVFPVYQKMRFVEPSRGRLLTDADGEQTRRVCVLGHDLAQRLLGARTSLPASVRIGALPYKVVGIARRKAVGSVLDGNDDEKIFLPFRSMQRDFPLHAQEEGAGAALVIQPVSSDLHEQIIVNVRRLLAARHGFDPADPDALALIDTVATSRSVQKVFSGLALFSDVSSLMTVAMAAIGLTNILLISVRERTREIGIRRSVGARRRHIFTQFVGEGLVLSSVGGLFGLLAGAGLALLLGILPLPGFSRPIMRAAPALAACAIIVATGLAASVLPAWKAVKTDPVEAIRHG